MGSICHVKHQLSGNSRQLPPTGVGRDHALLGGIVTGGTNLARATLGFEEFLIAHAQPPTRSASIFHPEFEEFDILASTNCIHPSFLRSGTKTLIKKPNPKRASIFNRANDIVCIGSHGGIIKQKGI